MPMVYARDLRISKMQKEGGGQRGVKKLQIAGDKGKRGVIVIQAFIRGRE